ncbi:SusD/RagB family nutrient-binding outer membrane lipoprotein [Empedobacter sp. UBA7494]|uniref:SusD/RagB family nutrient-binding outer membrane lipoprotein n=1 Tax=Empedobacter sp. UBA7494 TaxID=1946450 RepID=UPI0025C5BDBF|nr:SusD/RagB family nutrient-binding outer membrane lipoprotein [Empedobacter sp. UBA7494]
MKKLFLSISVVSLLGLTSCINDDPDYNKDDGKLYDVPAQTLLSNVEKSLTDQMTTPNVNSNVFRFFQQYWATTMYQNDARFNFTGTRKVPDNHWTTLYRRLGDLKSAKEIVNKEVKPSSQDQAEFDKIQKNKIAVLDLVQVYIYQIIVDSFGDVPYKESLDPLNVLPKYDNDQDIYPDLIARVNKDLADMDISQGSFTTGDFFYNGNVAKWVEFGNSLKIKLGINLADVDAALAKTTIESAFAGAIKDESQNTVFAYPSTSPNYNPIYANVIASNRSDFVPADTFVNRLVELGDPRINGYFTKNNDGIYKGGVVGKSNTYSALSHISDVLVKADAPGYLFQNYEINFYLAEAASRGFSVGGSAKDFYEKAVTQSIIANGGTETDAVAYLAKSEVSFSAANWKKLIGEQSWIAFFNRPFESWNSYRRLDYPILSAPNAVAAADGKVPTRYTYPINEQTVNNANWQAAGKAIGGDKLTTKVFWDIF